MKFKLLFFFLISGMVCLAQSQVQHAATDVMISVVKGKTRVLTDEKGTLCLRVTPRDVRRLKARGIVRYSDFGVRGDGKHEDRKSVV